VDEDDISRWRRMAQEARLQAAASSSADVARVLIGKAEDLEELIRKRQAAPNGAGPTHPSFPTDD
jgi:hypothetical protein